jgi:hypothetical protein
MTAVLGYLFLALLALLALTPAAYPVLAAVDEERERLARRWVL